MSIAVPSLTPFIATAAIGWLYYRRIRRQFGRQPWKPGARYWLRVALLSLLLAGLLIAGATIAGGALAVSGGLAAGIVLGALSLHHTRIEHIDGARWYTPNPWIGGALSLVLLGRLAWRWQGGAFAAVGGGAHAAQDPSALTLGIVAALLAFYLVNGTGLAWRMRDLARDADLPAQRA